MAKSFFITLRQVVIPAGESEKHLPARAAAKLGVPAECVLSCSPVRRSLDARKRRGKAVQVYHLRIELPNSLRRDIRKMQGKEIVFEQEGRHLRLNLSDPGPGTNAGRPLVVGAGPAGMFSALRLAQAGWKPILIDRGDEPDRRRSVTAAFWRSGELDTESNVLYGVGGAGLFSDGKLNTRHKDRDGMRQILGALVEAGAPESILVDASPHVGSDLLADAVKNIVRCITDFGGELRTRTRLDALEGENGKLRQAHLTAEDGTAVSLPAESCILASGHSARDVYAMLHDIGCALEAKPFAVGLRVEMPQETIDASQRGGAFMPAPGEAASFRLSRAPAGEAASCYTFCMCPGGLVIACASEAGRLAVNGMSYHARAGEWGNAAFLTPALPDDFASRCGTEPAALRGIAFQRQLEEKAFRAGMTGGEYALPASRLTDFMAGVSGILPDRRGTGRAAAANLRELLPERMAATLAEAIPAMLARLRKVSLDDVMVYGTETRTSSPVRILRGADGCCPGFAGLYPAGEGSGYAGGIMTSALDGWNAAGRLMAAQR